MLINLPFTVYRFRYQIQQNFNIPRYSGTLWHAVLGRALKQQHCFVPSASCQGCLFAQQCDYLYLFKNINQQDNCLIALNQAIPSPHIIRVETTHGYSLSQDEFFDVQIILIGEANLRLDKIINSMQQAGLDGLGKARIKAALIQVEQVLNEQPNRLIWQKKSIQPPVSLPLVKMKPAQQLELTFITPFRPSGKMAKGKVFLIEDYLMGLIRRISLLQYFYTPQPLAADYIALKKLTQSLPILTQNMHWSVDKSLKYRQNQHQQSGGWLGTFSLNLENHQTLLPFLYLGQWLNSGKNANMGFGQYQLHYF